ncbi:MAG TPA: hypothetical protein VGD67_21885 [Pseudonocardiaceae bacterium]
MASQFRDQRRIDALFRALASDYLLREQFVTDPAQILTEYVSGRRLDPEAAAAANHLVYAMVSNPRLLRWLAGQATQGAAPPTGDDLAHELARALARDGDEETLMAVIRVAKEEQDLFSAQIDVLRGLIHALGRGQGQSVFVGTEMSSPGTEMSPGHGTEMSPGEVFRGTEMSSPGTEMSPGQLRRGTEMSSPGTEMSPGQVFRGTEMSSPGTEMSPGQLRQGTEMSSPGTEMSPGQVFRGTEMSSPGTEISPGPGTDVSPGHLDGIDIDVTLRALVEFANELRRAGALNTMRFR